MQKSIISTTQKLEHELTKLALAPETIFAFKKNKPYSYKESLCARLLVMKLCRIPTGKADVFFRQSLSMYRFEKYYWSISHKGNVLAAAIDTKPVGIDIELNAAKDTHLLSFFSDDEWRVLGKRTWTHFYMAWTAKEACLKALSLPFFAIKEIRILKRRRQFLFLAYKGCFLTAKTTRKGRRIICVAA